MQKTLLVIDDEKSILESLSGALGDEGYSVKTVCSGKEGLEQLSQSDYDVVLLDIWMDGMDGIETLKRLKAQKPQQIVVMMSGHGTIETAVTATKLGAYDFIEKPLSLEKLLLILKNALAAQDLLIENEALRNQLKKNRPFIGQSPSIQEIKEVIHRVAPTTGSILITGENGTGKELVAHWIHSLSDRFQRPFVEVNCAAIPEELIESELFGHEKGAFTGAIQLRRGKFEFADGGTLFLDEIGDMSIKTQAKILRILQEQKFERVGGSGTLSVNVRVVAATNKDLKQEIHAGHFREDLFYRLNVIPIHIPALRDRPEDIPLLVENFIKSFVQSYGRKERRLTTEATQVLKTYSWPGNVRELKNLIERMIILTRPSQEGTDISSVELLEHMKNEVQGLRDTERPATGATFSELATKTKGLKEARHEFEKALILNALKENEWNISKTALALGIERTYLHRKIKSFGIEAQTEP